MYNKFIHRSKKQFFRVFRRSADHFHGSSSSRSWICQTTPRYITRRLSSINATETQTWSIRPVD